MTEALGETVEFAVILDRDFRPDQEIAEVARALSKRVKIAHIHERKEIENYVLVPTALDRAISEALAEQRRRGALSGPDPEPAEPLLARLTDDLRHEIQGQYVGRHIEYSRRNGSGKDTAQISAETAAWFDQRWSTLEGRLSVLPGKRVLSALNAHLQQKHNVTITARRIVSVMRANEIPSELVKLLNGLDRMLA